MSDKEQLAATKPAQPNGKEQFIADLQKGDRSICRPSEGGLICVIEKKIE